MSLLMCYMTAGVFAEGSLELNPDGGDRLYLYSGTNTSSSLPFPSEGLVRVYAKAGETIYLGSSAQGIGNGTIRWISPSGVIGTSGSNTSVGRINNRTEEKTGPRVAGDASTNNGYNPVVISVNAGEEGVWSIFFISTVTNTNNTNGNMPPTGVSSFTAPQSNNTYYITAFDVSVRSGSAFIKGRAYLNAFAASMQEFDRKFKSTLYVQTYDGYRYEVKPNEMAGYIFNFFSNNKGIRDNSGQPTYKSANTSTGVNIHNPFSPDTNADVTHKIFFNNPANDLPETAKGRRHTGAYPNNTSTQDDIWLKKEPFIPVAEDLTFVGKEGTTNLAGSAPLGGYIYFKTNQAGSYYLNIDVDKNANFTDPIDVTLEGAAVSGQNKIYWDGRDGNGNAIQGTIRIEPSQTNLVLRGGEVHFPFVDVENNVGGMIIRRLNGANPNDDTIYWDDTGIDNNPGPSNPLKTAAAGVSSSTNGHKWGTTAYSSTAFGNNKVLDTWAYIISKPIFTYMDVTFRESDLEVVSITSNQTSYCVGEDIKYTVVIKNNGPDDVKGAKIFFYYPPQFLVNSVANTGDGTLYVENTTPSPYIGGIDLANKKTMTLTFSGKLTDYINAGTLEVSAFVMRPKDHTDPGATNPDDAPPTDPFIECPNGQCNNYKEKKDITINKTNISIYGATVTEGSSGTTYIDFPISLSQVSKCDITVDYKIQHLETNGDDILSPLTGQIVIPANQLNATLKIQINPDKVIEKNERFKIILTNASGGNVIAVSEAEGTINDDDLGLVKITAVDGYEEDITPRTKPAKFMFSFQNGVTSDTPIDVKFLLSGTADGNSIDYEGNVGTAASPASITIPANTQSIELELPVIDDNIVEGTEEIIIDIVSIAGDNRSKVSLDNNVPVAKIFDNDEATLTLSPAVKLSEGDNGTTKEFVFTITLDKPTKSGFTIDYKTIDQEAKVSDNDYQFKDGFLTFSPNQGNQVKEVKVIVNGDDKIEANEKFKLQFSNLSFDFNGLLKFPVKENYGEILNDDLANIVLTKADGKEGSKSVDFIFTLENGKTADKDIEIFYELGGNAQAGIDYTSTINGSVILKANTNSVKLELPAVADGIIEGNETVILTVPANGVSSSYAIQMANSTVTAIIEDIDIGRVSITDVSESEGNNNTKYFDFQVTLDKKTQYPLDITYSTQDGTALVADNDYISQLNKILTFTDAGIKPVRIEVRGDMKIELDETFKVILEQLSHTYGGNLTFGKKEGIGTIINDDSGNITITKVDGNEENTVSGQFIFSFPQDVTAGDDISIPYNLSGSSTQGYDYTINELTPGVFVFPKGQNSAILKLDVIDDDIIEGTESAVLNINNGDIQSIFNGIAITNPNISLNILDNDNGKITIIPPLDIDEGNEGNTHDYVYTLVLDKATKNAFEVKYHTEDITATAGADYAESKGQIKFNADTPNQNQTISVRILGDNIIEANEQFKLILDEVLGDFGGRITIVPVAKTTTSTIIDDDFGDVSITSVNGTEGGQNGSFIFSLPAGIKADKDILIDYSLSGEAMGGGVDYMENMNGRVTIKAGDTQTILNITIKDDQIVEGIEDVRLNASIYSGQVKVALANNTSSLTIFDNDYGTITIKSLSKDEGNAGTTNFTFEVILDKQTKESFTVNYSTQDGTAIASADYTAIANGQLVFDGQPKSQFITVEVKGDKEVELDEQFFVELMGLDKNFNNHLSISEAKATGTIINDDKPKIIIIPTDGDEKGPIAGNFRFKFEDDYVSSEPTVITYSLLGSATKGADYTDPNAGTITIPAGINYVDIELPVLNDDIVEGTEDVIITASLDNALPGITLPVNTSKLNILDKDVAEITLTVDNDRVKEGNSGTTPVTFTVTLSKATKTGFTLNYRTEDITANAPEDYESNTGQVPFIGNAGENYSIAVNVKGDLVVEQEELFKLVLEQLSKNFEGRLTIAQAEQKVIIENDDFATITINHKDGVEGSKNGEFIFKLPAGMTSDQSITLYYKLGGTASPSTDYTTSAIGTVTIPAGKNEVILPIVLIDDDVIELDKTVILEISNVINPNAHAITLQNNIETLTIKDDDTGVITLIAPTSQDEKDSGDTPVYFTVNINKAIGENVSIPYSFQDVTATLNSDYNATAGVVTFPASAVAQEFKIEASIIGDKIVEQDEKFNLILGSLSQNFGGRLTIQNSTATYTILDDDKAVINITSLNGKEGSTQNPRFRFEFTNGNTSDKPVVINYSLDGTAVSPADYTVITNDNVSTNTVTIPAGTTYVDLEFDVVDDDIVELTETISFKTVGINSTSTEYPTLISLSNSRPIIQIEDNDSAELLLKGVDKVKEGNTPDITKISYTITLTKSTQDPFTIKLVTEDGLAKQSDNDYFFSPKDVVHSGNKSEELTVTVDIIGDTKVERDEDFFFKILGISNNYEGRLTIPTPSIQTIIENDDFADITITAKDGEEAVANNKPGIFTFSLPPNITVDEDLRISYTLGGTAKSPEDYAPVSGQAIIKKGTRYVDVQIDVVDDDIVEGDETVVLTATLQNAPYGIKFKDNTNTASLRIIDNDYGFVSINNVQVLEQHSGEHTLTFKVSIDKEVSQSFKVYYHTEDQTATAGEDYKAIPSSEISIGRLPTDNNPITVTYYGDRKVEADEVFRLVLTGIEDLFGGHLTLDPTKNIGLGTLLNDDKAEVKIAAIHGQEDGDNGKAIYKFTLVDPSGNEVTADQPVTISYLLAGTATTPDYTLTNSALATQIVIPADKSSVELVFNIVDDKIVEGTETIILENLTVSSAYANEIKLGAPVPVLEIRDNDRATLTVTGEPKIIEGDSGEKDYEFLVKLDMATAGGFTINYKTQDITATAGEDYVAQTGSLTFLGNENETYPVIIKIKGDHVVEPDEIFSLLFEYPSKDFEGRLTFPINDIKGTIENNDFSTIEITAEGGKEGAQNATFTFQLTNEKTVDEDIFIEYDLDNISAKIGEDYTINPLEKSPLKIPKGSNSVTLTLTVIDDNIVEGIETVKINAKTLSNSRNNIIISNPELTLNIEDNDEATLSIQNVSKEEGDSNTTSFTFTVGLDKSTQKPFSVKYATADDTAIAGEDYQATTGTLNFGALSTDSKTFTVQVNGDKKVEANEVFNVFLSDLSIDFGGKLHLPILPGTGTIINDDKAVVNITAVSDAEGSLTKPYFRFELTNGNISDGDIVIDYSLQGTAVSPADYAVVTNDNVTTSRVTIPAGSTYVDLEFDVVDDDIVELTETISFKTVGINTVNTSYPSLITLSNNRPVVQIGDNDSAELLLTGIEKVTEGNTSDITKITYTLKLTKSTQDPFTIKLATEDGLAKQSDNDYFFSPKDILYSGDKTDELNVTVDIIGDNKVERDEDFLFKILGISNNYEGRLTIPTSSIKTWIENDDFADITITAKDGEEAPANNKPGIFTFSLPPGITVDQDLEISYTFGGKAKSPADYAPVNGSVVIKKGDHLVDVQINIVDDEIVEGDETVVLTAALQNAPYGIQFKDNNNTATLKIIDNDYGFVSINNVQVQEQHSGDHTLTFNVSINKEVESSFKVYYHTEDQTATAGEDYKAIPSSERSIGRLPTANNPITVTYYGDRKVEADEIFKLVLTGLEDLFGGHLTLDPTKNIGLGTLLNDDSAEVKVTAIHGEEDGDKGKAIYKFTLVDPSGNEVTVDKPITISYRLDGTATAPDYTLTNSALATQIVIPADKSSVELVFNIVDDKIVEGTETIILENLTVSSAYANEIKLGAPVPVLEIRDNDRATLTVTGEPKIIEGDSGEKDYEFLVKLDMATAGGFTVNYKTQDITATAGEDYVAETGTLNFSGNENETYPVIIKIKGDHVVEPDEVFSLLFEYPSKDFEGRLTFPINDIKGTIENDDFSAIEITAEGGKEGAQNATFTFKLTNGKTVDEDIFIDYDLDDISAKIGEDYTINPLEKSPLKIPKGSNSVTLTLTVIDDNIVEGTEEVNLTATVRSNPRNKIALVNPKVKLEIEDNDSALISISSPTITEGDSNTKDLEFTVSVSQPTQEPFIVRYSTADGTAKAGSDYIAEQNGVLAFDKDNTTRKFIIKIIGDKVVEATEQFYVALSGLSNDFGGHLSLPTQPATATILDNDYAKISITGTRGKEEGPLNGQFIFSILNGYSSDTPFTIDYDLTGEATLGEDYGNAAKGTITFEPGETEKILQIEVIDDDKVEEDETVLLTANLTSVYPQITLDNQVCTIIIEDNDSAMITLTGTKSVVEGKDGYRELEYTVKLNNSSAIPFDIAYFTEDITAKVGDDDYLEAKGILRFKGDFGEEHTFKVYVKGDEKVELDEIFRVAIKAVDNGALSGRLNIAGSPIDVTIINDDEGQINITKVDGAETVDNSKPAQFIFSLNGNITSEKDITIPYSLSTNSAIGNGVDYVGNLSGTVVIQAGQQSATLTLPVVDDEIVEGTETLTLTVLNAILPKDITLANSSQTLSIIDNDEAYITIQDVNVLEGNNGNTTMEFSVAIDKPTQEGFSVFYKTEDGTAIAGEDYLGVNAGTLTFNRLSKTALKLSITVFGDTKVEADEILKLVLTGLSNTYEGRLHLPTKPAIGTIINDDNLKIEITGTDGQEKGEVKGTFKFTLLDGVTVDQPVTITYNLGGTATGNGVDYNDLPTVGKLVINAGEHSGTVFINVIDDIIIEGTEDVIIEATLANNPYPDNIKLSKTTHKIDIEDNDYGELTIDGPLSIIEGNFGTQFLDFEVTLSNPTTRSFTVKYETEDGTATLADNDYQYATGVLSFSGQKPNEKQLIRVAINGDTKVEGNEFFKVIVKELSETFGDRLRIMGSPAIANIIDDDNIELNKTISITKQDGEEGLSDAAFIFSYPQGVTLDTDTKINFNLAGTAELNKDYTISGFSSSIVIPAGKNSTTLRIKVIDDEIVESTEQVDLTIIGAPINQKYPDVKMESNTSILFIEDNDYGKIMVQSRSISEGDSNTRDMIFTLRLDKETAKEFKVKFHTEDGTAKTSDFDYLAANGEAFFSGKANELQEITIRIIGDKKIEADEYFELLLTELSNTFDNRLSIVNTKLTGTIENDDRTRIIVTKTNGEEGGDPVTFTFTLADDVTADEPILIDYTMTSESTAIGNGVDYIGATSGNVTIAPGDKSVTLTLDVVDDDLIEDDETIVLKVNAIRGKYTNEIAIPTESTTAYIKDNDNAEIRILGPVEVTEGDVGTTEAKFTVILNNNVGNPFTVNYRTVDGTATVADNDYIPKSGTLDFGGTKGERKEIIILVNGDKKIEGDEDFFVQLFGLSENFNNRLIIEVDKAEGIIIDDDNIEANKVIHITKTDGAEGGEDVVFTFSFPQNIVSDYPTKIPYALSGIAQGAGKDYIGAISGEVIIPAGANSITLRLPVVDDDIVEGTEVIELKTGNVVNENYGGIAVNNSPIRAYILDNDYGKIRIEDAQISEGDLAYKQIILDVTLDKETGLPFTVSYNTEDGTAKVTDNDYVGVNNGTLSFAGKAGEKQTIAITIVGDKKIEADEVFDVVLKALSRTFEGRLSIQKDRGTATILNDDKAEITITAMDGAEAGTIPIRFKFSYPLGYTSDIPTVIDYTLGGTATAGGVDYKSNVNGVFAIPADKESAILELPVIDDEIIEDDETVSIAINSINTNYPASITVNPDLPVAKIIDNDFTILKLSAPVTKKEGDNGTTAYTFDLTLEKETGSSFVVKYTTQDGTATVADKDYVHTEGDLSFAGHAGEVQSVTVWVNGDLKIEANEDFKFKVFGLSNTFNNRLTIPITETNNVILNDDSSLITVSKVDGIEGMQDGQFVFTLNPGVTSDKDITIHFKLGGTATASDYIALSSATNITIPAGENRAVLNIKTIDDDIVEETETVVLNVTKIDNPYNNVSMALPIPVLNIYDNDTGYLTITSPAPVLEGHSGTKTVTFTITLDKTTDKPFTVNYTTVDGTATVADKDYVKASGYLSFAGYTGETKKVDVTIIGDTKYEDDETFGLKLMNLAPTFDGQLIIGPDGKGVILNDDFAPMAMDDYVTTLEDEPVTFSVTANDKHDEGIDPKTVKIVTPPSIGKVVVHADGTVTYSPDKDVNGYDTFTYTVKDIFGRLSNEARVQITIIPVNDAPIAVDDIYYVQRDSSIRENVGLNDYDVDGDVLTFRVLEFPKHGKIEFFDGMDGAFVYVPNPGFTGIDTFVYEVKDPEGLKDTANVTLYVQPKVRVDLTPVLTVVTEGEVVKITAKLSEPLFQDVNVVLDFSGTAELNKDYTLEGNFDVIRIAAGDTVTTQYFLVKTLRDFIKEDDESVEAKIIAVDPSNFVTIGDSALVMIQDFYPEGKPLGPDENGNIQPDPYMSPNGDGEGNEVFVIYNIEQFPDNEVVIYNRWGNEVFRIKGYNNKDVAFAGKANAGMLANKGEDLVDGVYFFIIHTKDANGKPLLNKGYVIMRR